MLLVLILIILSSIFLWFYKQWSNVKNYWKVYEVPHHPPNPILGSLTFLQRQNPALWMRQLYNDFKSPYVGIWLFWRPGLVINSPEIAKRVLVKDADVFRNRFLSSGKTDPIGALNLFTVNIMSTDYSTDVIGESAFGISCETTKTGDSIMRRITREFMEFNLHRGLCWSSIFFFPELVDIFRFTFFPKKSIEELRHIFRSIIKLRGGYDKKVKDSKDLLDALLKLKQDAALENEDISEDVLISQAAIFLLGGFDTSGTTLSWILYNLAWHPQYQDILYNEIVAAKQQLGDKDFDSTTLENLTYLTCVIKETLRIYPSMGWLDHIAAKDYRIDDKLTVKAGTVLYVNAVAMQVDPQYFPEPFVFKPDRFLPENEKYIKPYTYMPFGVGPRSCIGMRFAYQTIRQGVVSVVLNYEVKTLPDSPKPFDIKVEKNGMFYVPNDEKMIVQFVPRQKY